jgi:myo-inositol-1-phosphate synthase
MKKSSNDFDKKVKMIANDLAELIKRNSSDIVKQQKETIYNLTCELQSVATEINSLILNAKERLKEFEKSEMSISKLQTETEIDTLICLKELLKPYCPHVREMFKQLEGEK